MALPALLLMLPPDIDILLIHGVGGQINFINSAMDVSKEFAAFLNEQQAEIENDSKK
jgi:hypothetical protein